MVKLSTTVGLQTLAEVRLNEMGKPIHYNEVRDMIAIIKKLLKTERNPEVRRELAAAGVHLSKILLK